jgi:hypothetical protein
LLSRFADDCARLPQIMLNRQSFLPIVFSLLFVFVSSVAESADKNNKNNNNAQERRDDQRIASAREDLNDIEKKLQADIKQANAADGELKKLHEKVVAAKKELDAVRDKTEKDVAHKLKLSETTEAQRKAFQDFDEASKPVIAAMKSDPKYVSVAQKADAAEKLLKELAARTDLDDTSRQHMQSQASKDLADWRYNLKIYLDNAESLKPYRDKLAVVQAKLTDIRTQVKMQTENHGDVRKAEKLWDAAKASQAKADLELQTLRRKIAADNAKLVSERSQLAKAIAQDKQNNNSNKNKNNKNGKR